MLKYEKDKLLNPHICKLYSIISDYMNTNDPYIHGVVFIEPSEEISNQKNEIIMPEDEPTDLVQTSIIEEVKIEPSIGDWKFSSSFVLNIKSIPVDFSQHLLLKEINEDGNNSSDYNNESPINRSRCDTIDNLGIVDYELENNPTGYRTRSSSSSLLLKKKNSFRGEDSSENEEESDRNHIVSELTLLKKKISDYHPHLNDESFEAIKEEQTPRPTEEQEEQEKMKQSGDTDENNEEEEENQLHQQEEEKEEIKDNEETEENTEKNKEKEEEEKREENKEEESNDDVENNEENEIEINEIHYENDNSTTTNTLDNNNNNDQELPPIPTSVGDLTARTASQNDIPSLQLKESCENKETYTDTSTEDSNLFSNDNSSELLTPSPIQQQQQQNTNNSTLQIEQQTPLSNTSSLDNPVDLTRSISITHLKEMAESTDNVNDTQTSLNLSLDVNDLPFSPSGQIPNYSYSYEGLSSPFTPTVPNVQIMSEISPYTSNYDSKYNFNDINNIKKDEKNDKE